MCIRDSFRLCDPYRVRPARIAPKLREVLPHRNVSENRGAARSGLTNEIYNEYSPVPQRNSLSQQVLPRASARVISAEFTRKVAMCSYPAAPQKYFSHASTFTRTRQSHTKYLCAHNGYFSPTQYLAASSSAAARPHSCDRFAGRPPRLLHRRDS